MITRDQHDRLNKLDDNELLAKDTLEAAEFAIERQDLASKNGFDGWELRGMDWATWCQKGFVSESTQPAAVASVAPSPPPRARTIQEIEADSARIDAAENAAAAKAKPWAAAIERISKEQGRK